MKLALRDGVVDFDEGGYRGVVLHSVFATAQLLKRERIKRKIYATREDARSDVFDHIEVFYN